MTSASRRRTGAPDAGRLQRRPGGEDEVPALAHEPALHLAGRPDAPVLDQQADDRLVGRACRSATEPIPFSCMGVHSPVPRPRLFHQRGGTFAVIGGEPPPRPHIALSVAPAPLSTAPAEPRIAVSPLPKREHVNAPDRI